MTQEDKHYEFLIQNQNMYYVAVSQKVWFNVRSFQNIKRYNSDKQLIDKIVLKQSRGIGTGIGWGLFFC